MMDLAKICGERLLQARRNKKLSQQEVGEQINLAKDRISKYEAGINLPSGEMLLKLASVLDVSVDWLLGNE